MVCYYIDMKAPKWNLKDGLNFSQVFLLNKAIQSALFFLFSSSLIYV